MEYLSLNDMATIAATVAEDPTATAAELARCLARPYFTVAVATRKIRQADGWYTPVLWGTCAECGEPLLMAKAHPRKVHVHCEHARLLQRARRQREKQPGKSTPYARRWKEQHPEAVAAMREQEKAQKREEWPTLPEGERAAMLAKLHRADRRDYPITLELASARGDRWDPDEDQYILEHQHEPARDVALHLGRTLWGVRGRKVRLRKMGLGK